MNDKGLLAIVIGVFLAGVGTGAYLMSPATDRYVEAIHDQECAEELFLIQLYEYALDKTMRQNDEVFNRLKACLLPGYEVPHHEPQGRGTDTNTHAQKSDLPPGPSLTTLVKRFLTFLQRDREAQTFQFVRFLYFIEPRVAQLFLFLQS